MTAHITYPNIPHSTGPATSQNIFLTDILRNTMKFDGVVITDDMR
jgi:beta-N-acetylhexosaminidase